MSPVHKRGKKEVKMLKNNKKGLSTIVATLIIILLVLVAAGIIWVVVRNVVQEGTDQIGNSQRCFQNEVEIIKVSNSSLVYNVTISKDTGNDEIAGVRLVFVSDDGESSEIHDVEGTLGPLETKTVQVTLENSDPERIEAVVYFLDDAGNNQFCGITSEQIL